MISPVKNPIVTSPYGKRMLNGVEQFHPGIDYVSGVGDPSVSSILPGIVVLDFDDYEDAKRWFDPKSSAGNYVCVQHFLPSGDYFFARYLHLAKNNVSHAQRIPEGYILGPYANVGISYGAHLHIESYDAKWVPTDIGLILGPAGIPVTHL